MNKIRTETGMTGAKHAACSSALCDYSLQTQALTSLLDSLRYFMGNIWERRVVRCGLPRSSPLVTHTLSASAFIWTTNSQVSSLKHLPYLPYTICGRSAWSPTRF